VPNSPGADDNGSGTAGVLEIARVLKDIEVPMTLIFAAFDAEEVGLYGSRDLAADALDRDADIVFMMNMDMIGDIDNDSYAKLFYGIENSYAQLWSTMAQMYTGITGVLSGSSGGSDHLPFQSAGYDVCFAHEYEFSSVYHSSLDNTDHMNFDYMTEMVKATLATVYTVGRSLPPIEVYAVNQAGDGQSLQVVWQRSSHVDLDHYRITYYPTSQPSLIFRVDTPLPDTVAVVNGLTEGLEYAFYVQAVTSDGQESLPAYRIMCGTPRAEPEPPENVLAMPLKEAINLTWSGNNTELDFDHYAIIRNEAVIDQTFDTFYVDDDPGLGTDFYDYYVRAVDIDGIASDTLGVQPVTMRAATLEPERILAVNRTSFHPLDYVDEIETGEFLRQALVGYNFDYYSDTAATVVTWDTVQLDLVDMIDYGLVIIGAETGRYDDIGVSPTINGILDTLSYYMSIGGQVIVFGRWGYQGVPDTLDYSTNYAAYDDAYCDRFHIGRRILTQTSRNYDTVFADLIGASSLDTAFPDLSWDSLATVAHSSANLSLTINHATAIPCESFVELASPEAEVLYTYDSRHNDPFSEGNPVAWRYLGDDYQYYYFDIPLSFFNRSSAIAVLRQAVIDLTNIQTDLEPEIDDDVLPSSFVLRQNFPNPFNPSTWIAYELPQAADVTLTLYNVLGQKVRVLVDERQPAGRRRVEWDGRLDSGRRAASGLYFYRLRAGRFEQSKKMVLLK
ncbi:MAG: M28 family peptidase, partial [Candidatus Zixiibacteriota bacterium]